MRPDPERLVRVRARNLLQSALILAGLALLLSVPAWLLAGPVGALMALMAAMAVYWIAGRVPARMVLAQHGAGPLHPRHAPELYRVIEELYRRAGITAEPRLYYVPSPMMNAFAVGGHDDGGIAVSEGLLQVLGLRELAGVLAHEVSHLRHNDTRVMAMAAMMTELTVWGAALVQIIVLLLFPALLEEHGFVVWLILLAAAVAPTGSTILQLALSRNREYAADMEAAALLGDGRGLATALAILEHYNGSWLESFFGQRPRGVLRWLQTHPPIWERIRRLQELDRHGGHGTGWSEPLRVPRRPTVLVGTPVPGARPRWFLARW